MSDAASPMAGGAPPPPGASAFVSRNYFPKTLAADAPEGYIRSHGGNRGEDMT